MDSLVAQLASHYQDTKKCLVVTGSGGKTTLIIALARLYAREGNRVLVSTTTKMEAPQTRAYGFDTYFSDTSILTYEPSSQEQVFLGLKAGGKVTSPPLPVLQALLNRYDTILLEGDGSAHLGLKLHSEKDPVIPTFATATLALFSFSLCKKRLEEHMHAPSPSDYLSFTNPISVETYSELLRHPQGIAKGILPGSVVLANQSELASECDCLALSEAHPDLNLWFGSLHTDTLLLRNQR